MSRQFNTPRFRNLFFVLTLTVSVVFLGAGCMPTQTIIVRFEDLKSDMMALESSLYTGDWATFDWDKMEIKISGSEYTPASPGNTTHKPAALGSFEIPRSATPVPTAADQPDLDLKSIDITDTVKQVMRRRQERFATVTKLKSGGVIGEANIGMVLPPNGGSLLTLSEEDRSTAESENADRAILLREILRQKKLSSEKYDDIARVFADAQRSLAPRGVWVQAPNNAWEKVK